MEVNPNWLLRIYSSKIFFINQGVPVDGGPRGYLDLGLERKL